MPQTSFIITSTMEIAGIRDGGGDCVTKEVQMNRNSCTMRWAGICIKLGGRSAPINYMGTKRDLLGFV